MFMNQARRVTSILFLLLLGSPACGDDDSGGGTADTTAEEPDFSGAVEGVSATTAANEITPEQERELCDALEAYVAAELPPAEQQRINCTTAGLLAAAFSGGGANECSQARSACLQEPVGSDQVGGQCDAEELPEACTATIQELEACFYEQVSAVKALAGLSCSQIGASTDLDLTIGGTGPACDTVEQKCPGLMDDESAGGQGGGASTGSGSCSTDPGPDCCFFANDDECDEPNLCDPGTDTSDCS